MAKVLVSAVALLVSTITPLHAQSESTDDSPIVNLQGSDLRDYAYANYPDQARCIEQIVAVESGHDRYGIATWATDGWNPAPWGGGQHASGLGGFLPSTWATTPQGRAGESIWNGVAQVDAIAWMLRVSRGREFAAVQMGRC